MRCIARSPACAPSVRATSRPAATWPLVSRARPGARRCARWCRDRGCSMPGRDCSRPGAANQPVLCLTGQVPRAFLDQGRGHLHEMADQLGTAAGFTKWTARIEHPAQAPALVSEAFRQMRSGRPGPAVLEMPWDVFTQRAQILPVAPFAGALAPPPDTDVAETAARLLAGARFPMIFVGGGAQDASDAILELAELLDAPVVGFRSGRGIVSDAHELGVNIAAAWRLWPKIDVMLGIGTRLEVPGWRWPWKPTGSAEHPPGRGSGGVPPRAGRCRAARGRRSGHARAAHGAAPTSRAPRRAP